MDKKPNSNIQNKANTKEDIFIQNQNLLPIPIEIIQLFEDFLNQHEISDSEIHDLRNKSDYPFSALNELWQREGLSYNEFVAYVHEKIPTKEHIVVDFLIKNGVYVQSFGMNNEEPSLREIFTKAYGEKMSSLLTFYSQALLQPLHTDTFEAVNGPVNNVSSQLLALVQSMKNKTTNIDHLKTLDNIEFALEQYTNKVDANDSNVLTPEERLNVMPSLSDTQRANEEAAESASDAVKGLISSAALHKIKNREFRVGNKELPEGAQRELDFIMDTLGAIDDKTNTIKYDRWLPGFFDTGGGAVNHVLEKAMRAQVIGNAAESAIADSLDKYSSLSANPLLTKTIAHNLGQELTDASYRTGNNVFETLGSLVLAAGALFLPEGDGREKADYEVITKTISKKAEAMTKEALENGFVDKHGNYHPPTPLDNNIKNFTTSTAGTAAANGFAKTYDGSNKLDYNFAQASGVNPLGDFYGKPVEGNRAGSLGSMYFPDSKSAIANAPLEFSPSREKILANNLDGVIPQKSIQSLQNSIATQPNLYKGGDFMKLPEYKTDLTKANISDYRVPQINDALKNTFIQNRFDKAGNNSLEKLGIGGNALMGTANNRSPVNNFLTKYPGSLMDKALTGNKNFNNAAYSPEALAAAARQRNIQLPNEYSPETTRQLLQPGVEAPFAQQPNYPQANMPTPEQIKAYQEYQKQLQEGTYGQGTPKQSIPRNLQRGARQAGEAAEPAERGGVATGAAAGMIIGALTGAPIGLSIAWTLTGIPTLQIAANIILGEGKKSKYSEFVETFGMWTGIVGPSLELDENGEYVEQSSDWKANLHNTSLGRIPIIGRFFRSYEVNIYSQGSLYTTFLRKSLKAKSAGNQTLADKYLQNAYAAQKLHRLFFIFGQPTGQRQYDRSFDFTLGPQSPLTKWEKFSGRAMDARRGAGKIAQGFLGLAAPLRSDALRADAGMINGFFYFFSTIPSSAINITKGIRIMYKSILSEKMQNFFNKTLFTSKIGKFYDYFFSEKYIGKRSLFSQQPKVKKVYNNIFVRSYFGFMSRAASFMQFAQDPSKWIMAKLKAFLMHILQEITLFITKKLVKLLQGAITKLGGAIIKSVASSTIGGLMSTFGIGCLFIAAIGFVVIIISSTIVSGVAEANRPPGIGGAGVDGVLGINTGEDIRINGKCPLGDTTISCGQAGNGGFTHHRMRTKAIDISYGGVKDIYAVSDGILQIVGFACEGNVGGRVVGLYDTTNKINYYYYHVNYDVQVTDTSGQPRQVKSGERIGSLYTVNIAGCLQGAHLHIETISPKDQQKSIDSKTFPTVLEGKRLNSLVLAETAWGCKFTKNGTTDSKGSQNTCAPIYCDPAVPGSEANSCPKPVTDEDRTDNAYNI